MEKLIKPTFRKTSEDDFFKKMQREVHENILKNPMIQTANIVKSIGLLAGYIAAYIGILVYGNAISLLFFFYILAGLFMIVLFINAFHDAAHNAVFRNPKYNKWFTYVLELFGSNSFIWKKRHLVLHHPYANIQNWDIDIKQSDLVRIFPSSRFFNYHQYQHIYMWLLYPCYTLNWLFIRDFKDFFGSKDNYLKRVVKIPKVEYVKLFACKLFNLFYMLIVPMIVLAQPWHIILVAWITMHLCGSVLGVVALLSTHVDEHAHFPMAPEDGKMQTTWAEHQMSVTKDFSADSKLANFLFGGFTHHVAHHLFPGVAHTYYPYITKVIRRYAKEHNLPYTCYPFWKAVSSHFRLLRKNGRKENLFKTGEL
ncbi:fatty acid desaturase [Olivibacter sp. SDN3]|uniref:fatty acid desaturase family protein n=1 Tax=Olivibacter sp. SDN3 TaxID=2764720 RepID=UPI0016515CAA|nr:fatty acid desaturase [Olivibacter sp. SDN3]QNL51007.1 fatty acid desaturase [Olivibacter sp. SDN3]